MWARTERQHAHATAAHHHNTQPQNLTHVSNCAEPTVRTTEPINELLTIERTVEWTNMLKQKDGQCRRGNNGRTEGTIEQSNEASSIAANEP